MAPQPKKSKKQMEKKWKGKDWFSIYAPEWIGGGKIAETPATDSKIVQGRVVEVLVSDLTKDQSKYYMRLGMRAGKPEGMDVKTDFHTFFCVNEYIMRMARKGLGKVTVFQDVETKDKWLLQVSAIAILNRRGNDSIKKKVQLFIIDLLKSRAVDLNHDEFVKAAMAGVFQMKVKKGASKIYPVRFCEIIKIETLKRPE